MGIDVTNDGHKQTMHHYLKCVFSLRRCGLPTVHASETQVSVTSLTRSENDGWERLKTMFSKDDDNQTSPELAYVYRGTSLGVCSGIFIGGLLGGRHSIDNFVSRNEATVFFNEIDGKRRLNDHVMLSTMRGAIRWGWRLGFLTGLYLITMTSVSVYRNKIGVFDYVIAGGVTGSLYRYNFGLKGMVAGGVVGTLLGTMYGVTAFGLTRMTGVTMEDIRSWQQAKLTEEQRLKHEQITQKRETKIDPLSAAHDQLVKSQQLKSSLVDETPDNLKVN